MARYLRDTSTAGFQANIEVWIIVSINPDGSASHTRQNAHKVDLNRNFPYRWVRDSTVKYYAGPAAASEPETRALIGFLKTYRPKTEIIFHQPLGCVDLSNSTRAASTLMSDAARLPLKSLGTRNGSQAGYLQQLVPGSIALTTEYGYTPSSATINATILGARRVANSR